MHTVSRRAMVAGLALLSVCAKARAGMAEQLNVSADEGNIALTRYAADRAGKRPTVLLPHPWL
jgi:hypothetical protein